MTSPPIIRLDSSLPPTSDHRWACAPGPPSFLLRCDSRTRLATLHDATGIIREWPDPLPALQWMADTILECRPRYAEQPPPRWIGYLSYDLGPLFEEIPSRAADDLALPLFSFTFHPGPATRPPPYPAMEHSPADSPLRSTFSRPAYESAVQRALDYIAAGDIFQVNLSQRFTAPSLQHPARIYESLRASAPARYGAYLDLGDHALLSNSPELFLRITSNPAAAARTIITRPVKGTRPRAPGMDRELRDSVKDQAELNMIIDLERNDLGRVCHIGSVQVVEPRTIEAHPTVYHGVATIRGLLRDDVTFVDVLRATFPGGSITGAPKIRAMQIIDELEPVRRGPYCGAIGYLAADGAIEFNIAIRTIIIRNGLAHIAVGGGIVADSTPSDEYEETLVKARAMFHALQIDPATLPHARPDPSPA